ncbi:MAG: class A beta-lactamase-related serine hydrolase [Calditrichaeota bacterium]|nr:beta-lactamase family protein [Calditrichota bacterium]RQW07470.1 MAG: class A beta-lactamase-related serine hydrolase [Calditrichota bacterium]
MKNYLVAIVIFVLMFNQKIARVEIPTPEHELINFVHEIIGHKKAAKIDSFFTARARYKIFNGAVLVAEKGRILYQKSFGYSNFRTKDSLHINSLFQLASVTKPLTACAILMLCDRGLVSLDDDIRRFFPEFPYDNITVRLLLTHRSGLPDYLYFADRFWKSRTIPITNDDVLDIMTLYKPSRYYLPDRRYNYSNTNYCLLASIIEKVSGLTYAEFMKTQIFDPLGMHNTRILTYDDLKHDTIENLTTGYSRWGRASENSYLNGVVGDKGIFSTVEDLFRLDQALYQGNLVSLFALQEAFKPAHRDLRDYDNYGFGWRINMNGGNKIVFHSGWWKGYKTYFVRKIGEQKTIIVLTNTAMHNFLSIRRLSELI